MAEETARYPYVHVDVRTADVDVTSMRLFEEGATGVEERDAQTMLSQSKADVTLVASFETEEIAARVAEALGGRVEIVEGDAWRDAWREYFYVQRIGERLVIRPSWLEHEDPREGDVVLTLDPGAAFGSGIHETTRLCLREVESTIRGGERVLDVGCGSGVLAIAAQMLGAGSARGVDVDEDAVTVSNENAERNGVSIEVDTTDIASVNGRYDLVLANIQAHILLPMVTPLVARVAPGARLVLSGVLETQRDEVTEAFKGAGLVHERTEQEGEWVAIVLSAGAEP